MRISLPTDPRKHLYSLDTQWRIHTRKEAWHNTFDMKVTLVAVIRERFQRSKSANALSTVVTERNSRLLRLALPLASRRTTWGWELRCPNDMYMVAI